MQHVILYLGGDVARIDALVTLAKQLPLAAIVISSERDPDGFLARLHAEGIFIGRVVFDYQGWDTVSQFTHTQNLLRTLDATHVWPLTSSGHEPRALVAGAIAYLGTGIRLHAFSYVDPNYTETLGQLWRDALRALVWRVTGYLPRSRKIEKERMPEILELQKRAFQIHPQWMFLRK